MSSVNLPLLIEPAQLQPLLGTPNLLLVDLSRPEQHAKAHLPGAVFLPYTQLSRGVPPGPGKLPSEALMSKVMSSIGLTPDTHVVAYDDEGGGWAGRFLWTLDVIGHPHYSYLNGGLHAWTAEKRPLVAGIERPTPSQYQARYHNDPIMTKEDIQARLGDPSLAIWDARSMDEYFGRSLTAQKNGHIPGAVLYEWTRAMDPHNHLRLRDLDSLRAELKKLGISADKTIVTHCQTHHRSGFTWLVGKILGFPHIKAYPGSWAEWGNDPATPVETY